VYQPLICVNLTAQREGITQFLPGLATSWSTPDNKTWTFNLRNNVTFSSGDKFNAYVVWAQMYSFYYLSANSSGFFEGYQIFNMSNVNFGPANMAMLNQTSLDNPPQQALQMMQNSARPIYVVNSSTIVFREAYPFAYLPGVLVSTVGLVIDMQWVFSHGGLGTPASPNSFFAQNPIPGTGPYTFAQVSEGSFVKLSQNPAYWGKSLSQSQIASNPALDPGHARNVMIYAKTDDLARYIDLSGGTVQAATIIDNFGLVKANPSEFSIFTTPKGSGIQSFISLNTKIYPTNITAVRQAIVHSINYSAIYQQIYYGYVTPGVGPEYPAWPQFYDLGNYTPYSYNVTLAKQILQNARIEPTKLPPIQIYVQNSCGKACISEAESVQFDLSQIGISVNIQVMTFAQWCASMCQTYSAEAANPSSVAGICAYCWQTTLALTPVDEWNTPVSSTSPVGNEAIYSTPTTQACITAFENGSSTAQIKSICSAAQKQIYDDAPYIWLGSNGLWDLSGTIVWRTSAISNMYGDPLYAGFSTDPLFNTVTFVGS
jgi:ABC-type transport system substrate-binding protein